MQTVPNLISMLGVLQFALGVKVRLAILESSRLSNALVVVGQPPALGANEYLEHRSDRLNLIVKTVEETQSKVNSSSKA